MQKSIENILMELRPAFNRQATFFWFIICCAGFICRTDFYGVTSIVRSLDLNPKHYNSLLNFFHSSAFDLKKLMSLWHKIIFKAKIHIIVNGRIVFNGDHTKQPKDGRKIPGMSTMHQDSETSSKPSFFRGHHIGCIGIVISAFGQLRTLPLLASIQEGTGQYHKERKTSKIEQLMDMAFEITLASGKNSFLVLDAYFAVGPVFQYAKNIAKENIMPIHILTRAKKNIVAYFEPKKKKKKQRGRPQKYGKAIKLYELFTKPIYKFSKSSAMMYRERTIYNYLVLDLYWKPAGVIIRFILVKSKFGNIILMTTDLTMTSEIAVELYCGRATIESLFNILKNILGGLNYRFWSKSLERSSRSPKSDNDRIKKTTNKKNTLNTLMAIEKFINIQLIIIGLLQIISIKFPIQTFKNARSWTRTISNIAPSEFITRKAISNIIKGNLNDFHKDTITEIIKEKACKPRKKPCGCRCAS